GPHPGYQAARPEFLHRLPFRGAIPHAVILACLALLASDEMLTDTLRLSFITILCVILVWLASYDDDLFLPAPLRSLFLWLGARSYAIYLIHIPAFFLTREIWTRLDPGTTPGPEAFLPYMLTAGALILICSELNHRYVEQPLRHKGRRIAARVREQATVHGNEPGQEATDRRETCSTP